MDGRTAIVDLDGTLYLTNTFSKFVRYLFKYKKGLRKRLINIVLRRKLRLISHAEAKDLIMELSIPFVYNEDVMKFVASLSPYINRDLINRLCMYKYKVLNTAAPKLYASIISKLNCFDIVLATKIGEKENVGNEKISRLIQVGFDMNSVFDVFSDHYDDIPLFKYNKFGKNYLINPKLKTIKMLEDLSIAYEIIQ